MIFLIEYDRPSGVLVSMHTFNVLQRTEAADARLALELDLHRKGVEREVVTLEADSEADLRRTHGRYFYGIHELLSRFRAAFE